MNLLWWQIFKFILYLQSDKHNFLQTWQDGNFLFVLQMNSDQNKPFKAAGIYQPYRSIAWGLHGKGQKKFLVYAITTNFYIQLPRVCLLNMENPCLGEGNFATYLPVIQFLVKLFVSVTIEMIGPHGYISAQDWPLLIVSWLLDM